MSSAQQIKHPLELDHAVVKDQQPSMSDAGDARQRAEARRQKILARQRDRLQAITGVYTEVPGELSDHARCSTELLHTTRALLFLEWL